MPDHHFWLSDAQFARLQPLLPNKVRGVPRVDDRKVISGIIHVTPLRPHVARCTGLLRTAQDPLQPLRALGARPGCSGASHHCQPVEKGALSHCIGRTRGGLNSKLHALQRRWQAHRAAVDGGGSGQ